MLYSRYVHAWALIVVLYVLRVIIVLLSMASLARVGRRMSPSLRSSL